MKIEEYEGRIEKFFLQIEKMSLNGSRGYSFRFPFYPVFPEECSNLIEKHLESQTFL